MKQEKKESEQLFKKEFIQSANLICGDWALIDGGKMRWVVDDNKWNLFKIAIERAHMFGKIDGSKFCHETFNKENRKK